MYRKQSESTVDVVTEKNIHEGEGAIDRRFFFHGTTHLPVVFEVWDVPPGAGEGRHTHESSLPLEEIYYCVSGEGEMLVDGEDIPFAAGDAVLAPPGCEHGFRNTGDDAMKLVIVWGKPLGRVPSAEDLGVSSPP